MSAKIKVGDTLTHIELRLTLTVQVVGRMVYMTSVNGLPYTIEKTELLQQIRSGEWTVERETLQ